MPAHQPPDHQGQHGVAEEYAQRDDKALPVRAVEVSVQPQVLGHI